MTADGYNFDKESVVTLNALNLFVSISWVIIRQQRLNKFLLIGGIQDVRVDTDSQSRRLDSCKRSVKPASASADVMQVHGLTNVQITIRIK